MCDFHFLEKAIAFFIVCAGFCLLLTTILVFIDIQRREHRRQEETGDDDAGREHG